MLSVVWAGSNAPEAHESIQKWVSFHTFGHDRNTWRDSSSAGVLQDGKPVAGFVFHDRKISAGTIQFSGASTSKVWAQGATLHLLFSYMFDDLDCQMVTTGNAATNTGLHKVLERLGHRKYIIERGWGRETDLFFWTLTREQWLENKIMQRSRKWAERQNDVKRT